MNSYDDEPTTSAPMTFTNHERSKRLLNGPAHKAIRDGDTFEAIRNLIGPDVALRNLQSD